MIEHCFSRTSVLTRLRQGLLGPYLDDLATTLHQAGYAGTVSGTICGPVISSAGGSPSRGTRLRKSMRRWSRAISVACHRGRRADSPKLRRVCPTCCGSCGSGGSYRRLPLSQPRRLSTTGCGDTSTTSPTSCGAAVTTRKLSPHYQALPRHLLAGGAHGSGTPSTPRAITAFVCQEAATRTGGGRKVLTAAVRWVPALSRGLWRASAWLGSRSAHAAPVDPCDASPAPDRQPRSNRSWQPAPEVPRCHLRNQAILLLLARLGFRAHEVVTLRLEDIDWHQGHLRLQPRQNPPRASLTPGRRTSARPRHVSLPGTPSDASRRVFLNCRAPFRP